MNVYTESENIHINLMNSMYSYEYKDLRVYFTFEESAQELCRSILLTKYLFYCQVDYLLI